MPVERLGGDADRAIASVLAQRTTVPFELIVVSAAPVSKAGVRNVVEINRNPATRRNRAVSESRGEILAFIDDDAIADPDWLETACKYLDESPRCVSVGGPDPAPVNSEKSELISETMLATPWIGSGIAAHESRPGIFAVRRPSDIALVNLFVRRNEFTGFDESVGYIGEDTALIAELMKRGEVIYHSGVKVFHRRRAFPGPYLRQRWRYRVKTGRTGIKDPRVRAFLIAGTITLFFPPLWILYFIVTFTLGARTTRLPKSFWPLLPFAFALHHLTYYFGILWGLTKRFATRPGRS
ncbi:MAG TPA: glycosyltransferase [Thermoanaerobaculia bacterium]|nr:glycosyltransferase [Thermoanaerobaculia bacterium]